MKKDKNRMLPVDERLIFNMTSKIEMQHSDVLRMITSGMTKLFWEIGVAIKDQIQDPEILMKQVSDLFRAQFGSYFSFEHLLRMKRFADHCSPAAIKYISPFVSWDYIPGLFGLKSDEAWFFYVKLIHEEALTPAQLPKKTAQKLFEKNGLQLKNPAYPLSELLLSRPYNAGSVKTFFEGAKGNAFRSLFEPRQDGGTAFKNRLSTTGVDADVMVKIYDKILNFQSTYNHFLNLRFNLLFWNLGYEILRVLDMYGVAMPEAEIEGLIKELEKKYGRIFNQDQIYDGIKFAKQIKDPVEMNELAQTVRWEHLKILLHIDDRKAQLFYAQKVLANGWSTGELEKRIQINSYESSLPGEHTKRKERPGNSIQKTQSKSGNKTVSVTAIAVEEHINPDQDLNRNIFKNPDLIRFIKSV